MIDEEPDDEVQSRAPHVPEIDQAALFGRLKIIAIGFAIFLVASLVLVVGHFMSESLEKSRTQQRTDQDRQEKGQQAERARREKEEREAQERKETQEAEAKVRQERDKEITLRPTTQQTLIRLVNGDLPAEAVEWADAGKYAVEQKGVRVAVTGLTRAKDRLHIRLTVQNKGEHQLQFQPWVLDQFDANARVLIARPKDVTQFFDAGASLDVHLAADTGLERLRIELPAAAFQGYGQLRLEIPGKMLVLRTAANAPKEQAVPALIALLADESSQNQAIEMLGEMGPAAGPAVDALMRLAAGDDDALRLAVLKTLVKIGIEKRKDLLPKLLPYLAKPLTHDVCVSLFNNLISKEDIPLLLQALQHTEPDIRTYAVVILGQFKDKNLTRDFLRCLRDESSIVRGWAAYALGELEVVEALPALTRLLKEADKTVRRQALGALVKFHKKALVELIAACQDDDLVDLALAGLLKIRTFTKDDLPTLLTALQSTKPAVRIYAVEGLASLGDAAETTAALLAGTLAKAQDKESRMALLTALAKIDSRNCVSVNELASCLYDDDPDIVLKAMATLKTIGPTAAPATKDLLELLRKQKYREEVVAVIHKFGKGAVPNLVKILKTEDSPFARSGIIEIFSKLGPEAKAALPLLNSIAGNDPFPRIRKEAEEAIGAIKK